MKTPPNPFSARYKASGIVITRVDTTLKHYWEAFIDSDESSKNISDIIVRGKTEQDAIDKANIIANLLNDYVKISKGFEDIRNIITEYERTSSILRAIKLYLTGIENLGLSSVDCSVISNIINMKGDGNI